MNITDGSRARSALDLVAIAYFGEAGLMVVLTVFGHYLWARGEVWMFAEELLWLVVTGLLFAGIWQLKRASEESELLYALLAGIGVVGLFQIYWTVDLVVHLTPARSVIPSVIMTLVNTTATVILCIVLGRLGRTTPYAAGIILLVLIRALASLARRSLEAGDVPGWVYTGQALMTVITAVGIAVLAHKAKAALEPGASQVNVAPATPPAAQGGGALVATGLVLLALGIGISVASYSMASSGSGGGRYLVATGAIASGLVTLVRGLGRLGSSK